MIITGARIVGARVVDQQPYVTANLVEYLDAVDYSGSGTVWPARVGTNATLYNAPAWNNSTGYFTFVPTSLQYADTPWLGNFSSWTVECWYNLTDSLSTTEATAAVTTVYDDGAGTGYGNINYCIGNNSVSPGFTYMKPGYFNGSWNETSGAIPDVGTWYQTVGTWDGTTLNSYWNGAYYSSVAGSGASTANNAPTRIARRWDGPLSSIHMFPGKIAIVRIYNTALSSGQVLHNFDGSRSRFGI